MAGMTVLHGGRLPWAAGSDGVTKFTKAEGQAFARGLLTSEDYRNQLKLRIKNGTLQPAVEVMLWHYAYGKPTENININQAEQQFESMTTDELMALGEKLMAALAEAQAVESTLQGELAKIETKVEESPLEKMAKSLTA